MPEILTVAVCICDEVTFSDFIPPMEILSFMNHAHDKGSPMTAAAGLGVEATKYLLQFDYLAPTMKPVAGTGALLCLPTVNPTQTYAAALQSGKQYDIIWVPAGPLPDPAIGADRTPQEEIEFIKRQAPGAKYVMSACEGSLPLATAGILDGKRATTSKLFFKLISAITSKKITWIPKARWVVDGNIWTSSGVTAGSDMALAFVDHLSGEKMARMIRGVVEIPYHGGSEDDPFAEFHGLV